jgi:hypothetical protein
VKNAGTVKGDEISMTTVACPLKEIKISRLTGKKSRSPVIYSGVLLN